MVDAEGHKIGTIEDVRVPFQKDQVKNAPKLQADDELSPDEERHLYEHYGRSDYGEWQGHDRTMGTGMADDGEQPIRAWSASACGA